MDSELGMGLNGAKVAGMGIKSGSFAVLNLRPVSPVSSTPAASSWFAINSFQSTPPTLVIALESIIGPPARGTALGAGEANGLGTIGPTFDAGSTGARVVVGTTIGSLHFGHGSVWPSSCSWRTIILLEQWGQAIRKGSNGPPNLGNGKQETSN